MKDEFSNFGPSITGPATAAEAIVPSDSTPLQYITRGLYVGTGGDVSVEMMSGSQILIRNVQPGVLYPLRIVQVMATGTTASDLIGVR